MAPGWGSPSRLPALGGEIYDVDSTDERLRAAQADAVGDFAELDMADALVWIMTRAPTRTAGRWFEAGWAYAKGRWVIAVGERDSPFHLLAGITRVGSTDEAAWVLSGAWWRPDEGGLLRPLASP